MKRGSQEEVDTETKPGRVNGELFLFLSHQFLSGCVAATWQLLPLTQPQRQAAENSQPVTVASSPGKSLQSSTPNLQFWLNPEIHPNRIYSKVWNLVSNWFLLQSSSMTNRNVPPPLRASQMCEGTVRLRDASALPDGAVYGQLPPK
ncbi:hypothetical protein KOW79_006598 [Hemibagrus wyckioides]|uniref:Uncharacterized protein n=1 Tax=Hemibagrus wyckioides TaxID=337641 RepID=A0A9D3NXJ7_9TELE|nr:hypothetical protein KOW79_006598 [Hemibagrus wyckioides]